MVRAPCMLFSFFPSPCFAFTIREMLATGWTLLLSIYHGSTVLILQWLNGNKACKGPHKLASPYPCLMAGSALPKSFLITVSLSLLGMTSHPQCNIQDNLCFCFILLYVHPRFNWIFPIAVSDHTFLSCLLWIRSNLLLLSLFCKNLVHDFINFIVSYFSRFQAVKVPLVLPFLVAHVS